MLTFPPPDATTLPHAHAGSYAKARLAHFIEALRENAQFDLDLRPEKALYALDGVTTSMNLCFKEVSPLIALTMRRIPDENTVREMAARIREGAPCQSYSMIVFDDEGRWLIVAAYLDCATYVHVSTNQEACTWEKGLVAALWDVPMGTWLSYDWMIVLQRRDVAHDFYRRLAKQCRRLETSWEAARELNDDERRHLTIVLLCRVLFVAFIDAMGWLGEERGLIHRFGTLRTRDIYKEHLEPLFFEALNTPREERQSGRAFRGVPYLNGGLFARTELEASLSNLTLSDAALRALFRDVLGRYHFVAYGWQAGDNPVDPGVLGEVFERLMRDEFRVATGAFYTPPELASAVVDLALYDVLDRALLESELAVAPSPDLDALRLQLARYLAGHDERPPRQGHEGPNSLAFPLVEEFCNYLAECTRGANARQARAAAAHLHARARRVKVLDPAVGSGAFTLAVASALDYAQTQLTAIAGDARESAEERRRHIISRQLHGVDISEVAIMISELRLWLWLAAGMQSAELGDPMPLPNLNLQLRCGDSLLSVARRRYGRAHRVNPETESAWLNARERFMASHGRDAQEHLRELARLETEIASQVQEGSNTEPATQTALFEREEGEKDEEARQQSGGEEESEARDRWRRWRLRPTFEPYLHFHHILRAGGFDLVIGNPPWMRLSALARDESAELQRWYQTLQARGRTFGSSPDLAAGFYERAAELSAPGATIAMLLPAKLFRAQHGAPWRKFVLDHTSPQALIRCDDTRSGFRAVAYPSVVIARKRSAEADDTILVAGESYSGPLRIDELRGGAHGEAPWMLTSSAQRARRRAMLAVAPPLSESLRVRYGAKTGCNRVFVNPPFSAHTLPLLRGSDMGEGAAESSDLLLVAHDSRSALPLPPAELVEEARQWLQAHREALQARADHRPGDPLWRIARLYPESFGWRVGWPDIGKTLNPRVLRPTSEGGPIALNTVYYVGVGDRATARRLCAWLATDELRQLARDAAMPARGGYRRFDARAVGALPVPAAIFARPDRRVEQGDGNAHLWAELYAASERADGACAAPARALAAKLFER